LTRNWLVHGYADIRLDVVWQTATESVPSLADTVRALIARETP
jgi:uncharacterized protein with HEPN domain